MFEFHAGSQQWLDNDAGQSTRGPSHAAGVDSNAEQSTHGPSHAAGDEREAGQGPQPSCTCDEGPTYWDPPHRDIPVHQRGCIKCGGKVFSPRYYEKVPVEQILKKLWKPRKCNGWPSLWWLEQIDPERETDDSELEEPTPVSYTHLTLPTIYSV